jgi:energy-coupling factor transporter ATP-binding protein EcfA2
MRLGRVRVHGFRKLVDTQCTVIGRVVAVVGPNEAGKSSLLDLLARTGDHEQIEFGARPRGKDVTDSDVAVELWFRLGEDDLDAVKHVPSPTRPVWYVLQKTYDGVLTGSLEPKMLRDQTTRRHAEVDLRRFLVTKAAQALERTEETDGLGDDLDRVTNIIAGDAEVDNDARELVLSVAGGLGEDGASARARRASEELQSWATTLEGEHPNEAARLILLDRRPHFAFFDDEERVLASDYDLNAVAQVTPAALANLAAVAELDLVALAQAVARNDGGAAETLTEAANDRLRQVFAKAWKQSKVVVRVKQDGGTLRLLVSNEGPGYSSIAERSDGLKAFVALTAFAARQPQGGPLILLIDEAERHLHYDAQADLVRMLERQGLAAQVVYTTHSAGCLPSDLGTGIRAVVPTEGGGWSNLATSFWHQGPGFTPLLYALGAAATAFTPSRYAVLAEGATEMMLLPSLIREASDRSRLDYQVAPGIAETGARRLVDLELEAARVVYLVDGDDGGMRHSLRLVASGVPEDRILHLGGANSGLCIEDLLLDDVYLQGVNEILLRITGQSGIKRSDLNHGGRAQAVAAWCIQRGISIPGKPAVADAILAADHRRLLHRSGAKTLKTLHHSLSLAFNLPE